MKVKVAKPLAPTGVKRRQNGGQLQLNCTDLLDVLGRRVPRDAYIVMGVTATDLYPSEKWNFVFGMARLKQRVGVFSYARYEMKKDPNLALKRAMKVISHETGHAFGIKHCIHYHCLMNGANHLGETDKAPLWLCPVCLRKLHYGLKFDPAKRYDLLADWLGKKKMTAEQKWYEKRWRR